MMGKNITLAVQFLIIQMGHISEAPFEERYKNHYIQSGNYQTSPCICVSRNTISIQRYN